MPPFRNLHLKWNLDVIVDSAHFCRPIHINAGCFQLTLLLQLGHAASLLELLLTRLAFRFLSLGVGETRPTLLQHLLFVLVHVDGIGARRFGLWVGVDLTRAQPPGIIRVHLVTTLGPIQQLLIVLDALGRSPPNNRGDCAPLGGENFREMQEFLLFISRPFCLLDLGIEPLIPTNNRLVNSNVTYHLALHSFADFRTSRLDMRDH